MNPTNFIISNNSANFNSIATGAGFFVFIFIALIALIFYIYPAFCLMRIAKKVGVRNIWFAWIPILNIVLMLQIAKKPIWWIILLFIPIINIIIIVLVWISITKQLGKLAWLGILILIPIVNLVILGYLAFSGNNILVNQQQVKKKKKRHIFLFLIPNEEKEYFIENLSMLFSSGMNILLSLEAIKKETRSSEMRAMIDRLKEDVEAGLPIWKVLQETKFFPNFIISLIKIGENSGSLAKNLKAIAIQQKKDRVFNSKIRSAMMYPSFVLGLTLIVGIGIAWFILPRLTQVFDQLKIDLPLITRVLIAFGKFIAQYGPIVIPSFIVGLIILFFIVFVFSRTKFMGQFLLFLVPGIKRLIQETELARMGYILGTLLKSGLPIKDTMNALAEASTFYKYKKLYVYMERSVEDGNTFQQSFEGYKKSQKLIPATVQQMIMVGEKSGQLPEIFISIGENFEEKIENTTKNLTTLLEPVLLVIVWLGVVAVALAVILPIYSLIGGLNSSKGNMNSSPVLVETIEEKNNIPTPTPTPIQEEIVPVENEIEILETPTGFLNVRDINSAKGKKVGKVLPGEKYVFLQEKDGWYNITLSDGVNGWVSGEYVKVVGEEEEIVSNEQEEILIEEE